MGREVPPNTSREDLAFMKNILSKGDINHKYAVRIQTVLNRTDGRSTTDTAAALGLHPMTVS
jgi:predicted ArsR family transcriptional regulator